MFKLRPAEPGDDAFLRALHASTRQDLAALALQAGELAALLDMQHRAREASYRAQFPGAEGSVVVVDGAPVGRLLLSREPGLVRVVDIALVPAMRGRGIGEAVLREVLSAGVPVRLHVEAGNPARRLYERLGFTVVGEAPPYRELEWRAQAGDEG